MKTMSPVKRICISAICVALCYVLPMVFHAIGGGGIFSPIHFPVLLCGLICGPLYGALCGIIGPVLSSILSGMPAAPQLISMIPELFVYGFLSGLLFKLIHTKSVYLNLYLSLVPAMLAGRIVGGVVKVFVYMSNAEVYSVSLWVSSYLLGTLPGIILQLILIPALVFALIKTGAIPSKEALAVHE